MSFTYPVCLNLQDKNCIIIGGGSVALRKVNTLLAQKAKVTVISPDLCPQLAAKLDNNEFIWLNTYFAENLLNNAFLVITATDNRAVNQRAADYCNTHNILINVIDKPEESSFIVNSYFTKGDLLIAVSTNGASPALSRKIRTDLEETFADEYADILEIISEARHEALEKINDSAKRREFLQNLAQIDFSAIIQNKSLDTFRNQVKQCLSSYLD